MRKLLTGWIILFIALIGSLPQARAVSIVYETFDKGEGVWEYSYNVSDYTFDDGYGFIIYFDYGLYENITPTGMWNNDWDISAFEPTILLGIEDSGVYDALSLVDSASLTDPFTVQFNWLGLGDPGLQLFDIYDSADWSTLETSITLSEPISQTMTIALDYQEGHIQSTKFFDQNLDEIPILQRGLNCVSFQFYPQSQICTSFDVVNYFTEHDELISIHRDPSSSLNSPSKTLSSYLFFGKAGGDNFEILNNVVDRIYTGLSDE